MADSVITIVGNLTREPEMRFTPNGAGNGVFGVAVKHRRPDKNRPGEWLEDTSFFNVICWGTLAENVQGLGKGTRVIVTGRLQQRSWETEQGEKRSMVEIVADEVGPSLRWARAEISRNERRGPYEGNQPAQPANAGVGAPARNTGYDDFGEEPF